MGTMSTPSSLIISFLVATSSSWVLPSVQGFASAFSSKIRTTTCHSEAAQEPSTTSSLFATNSGNTDILSTLQECKVTEASSGRTLGVLDGLPIQSQTATSPLPFFDKVVSFSGGKASDSKVLLVICPQLGDFETWEYAEQLVNCLPELASNKIQLRVVGIGNQQSAQRFSEFTKLPMSYIYVDQTASIHKALQLHRGPNWDIPKFLPQALLEWFKDYTGASDLTSAENDASLVARAWLNYMAMCAGVAAPDTLPEILRGYFGDKTAPERLSSDEIVTVGDNAIVIKGTTDVKLGPLEYQSIWKNEEGYQRPAELATVRLRGMVEILSNMNNYVPDQTLVDWRGATFLLDSNGSLLYEHRDTGVLAYSKTMARPLTFLEPYIGTKALNPLELGDQYMEKQLQQQQQQRKNAVLQR